jgi:hypothetical protein
MRGTLRKRCVIFMRWKKSEGRKRYQYLGRCMRDENECAICGKECSGLELVSQYFSNHLLDLAMTGHE